MKLAVIYLLACATLFAHDAIAGILFQPKNDMTAQDFIDRSSYMSAIAADAKNGGALCSVTNATQAGPFDSI